MKKTFVLFALIAMLQVGFSSAGEGGTQTDFSGKWVLDLHKTHNVPKGLQSYVMSVKQTDKQITVDTNVEGNFMLPDSRRGDDDDDGDFPEGPPPGGGFPGGGGGGFPGGGPPGGGGFPGGPPGGGAPGGPMAGGGQMMNAMAFAVATPTATYNLDGTSTTVQIDTPDPGSATLKAAWKKSGKQLELSRVEDLRGDKRTIKVREQWKLSSDGQVLEMQRTVNSPRGSARVKMIFTKDQAHGENTQ